MASKTRDYGLAKSKDHTGHSPLPFRPRPEWPSIDRAKEKRYRRGQALGRLTVEPRMCASGDPVRFEAVELSP